MKDQCILAGISFGRTCIGLVGRPYETYRRIVAKGSLYELIPLSFVLSIYFGISALVKSPSFRPFTLTRHFVKTSLSVAVTALFLSWVFWAIGRRMGGVGEYKRFFLGWAYTLIPTLSWFLFASLLYIAFPPPRSAGLGGLALSAVFLIVSGVLLFWKIILSYLALRFGMKLDLLRIIGIVFISAPVIILYSIFMYKLGIFKIPFI